jgi:DNA-binding CsgD family transcriptional regulator
VNKQTNHFVTGDTAFAVDRKGIIVLWNAEAENTLGFSRHEALGKKCWELLCGIDNNGNQYCCRFCPLLEMNFRHEPVHSFHSSYKTASDQRVQFEVSCLTVFDKPGTEMLLHICRPNAMPVETEEVQTSSFTPASEQIGALSQREQEILELLAKRVSTRDIAEEMSISIRTVRTHIQHLMYKLQVHKRTDAVQVGKRLKLI